MAMTKVGPKRQVTIPKEVLKQLKLEVGDYLDVQVKGNRITMVPKKAAVKDDAWFHTPEWQVKEKEADEAIARGKMSGPFSTAAELTRHLRKRH